MTPVAGNATLKILGDGDTGTAAQHTFRADHTCTFVASKPGFNQAEAERFTGQVHVLDIGVPAKLTDEVLADLS